MNNFDVTKENRQEHNPHWPQIPDYSQGIPIVRGSGSGKAHALLHRINYQEDDGIIDEMYLYLKGPFMKQNISSS